MFSGRSVWVNATLAVVIVALLIRDVVMSRLHVEHDKRLLNMIAANSTHELAVLNKIDQLPVVKHPVGSEERDVIHPIGA